MFMMMNLISNQSNRIVTIAGSGRWSTTELEPACVDYQDHAEDNRKLNEKIFFFPSKTPYFIKLIQRGWSREPSSFEPKVEHGKIHYSET